MASSTTSSTKADSSCTFNSRAAISADCESVTRSSHSAQFDIRRPRNGQSSPFMGATNFLSQPALTDAPSWLWGTVNRNASFGHQSSAYGTANTNAASRFWASDGIGSSYGQTGGDAGE